MKNFFSKFLVGIIFISIGTVFTMFEIFSYDYVGEKKYLDLKTNEKTYVFDFNSEEYYIDDSNISDINIEIDESMEDSFKLLIKYPYQYMNIDVKTNKFSATSYTYLYVNINQLDEYAFNAVKDIFKNVISDLKNKKLYNYNNFKPTITIYVSSANKDKIKI